MQEIKCAIYTRKSTEEGLNKEFNTLEAQREAGENFVLSQKHQGWVLLPEHYDDGGFSGGNLNRPALKRLLTDVQNNKINMIVVYKIDRLTRSLTDFSKLIEILDKHKCSFVAVTQNFNTYDSMGRLTLNVLLSFAQFEREVGAERIRDKVAASKKKGMWMGGNVPFGYMSINKKLVVNQDEAKIVKFIYQSYSVYQSERQIFEILNEKGCRMKKKLHKEDVEYSKVPFTHAIIYSILNNPIYLGKIVHKNNVYDGQHDAIIDEELWDKVQKIKSRNCEGKFRTLSRKHNSLLNGLLECGCCKASMFSTRTSKAGKTYEYYVSSKAIKEGYHKCEVGCVPAGELDKFVLSKIQNILKYPKLINEFYNQISIDNTDIDVGDIIKNLNNPNDFINYLPLPKLRLLIERIVSRIIIYKDKLVIRLLPLGSLLLENQLKEQLRHSAEYPNLMELEYNINLYKKRGHLKILPPPEEAFTVDDTLLNAVVKAFSWREKLEKEDMSVSDLAKRLKIDRGYVTRIMNFTYLAPDIIEAILLGSQPGNLKISDIMKQPIPFAWSEQRLLYGFN